MKAKQIIVTSLISFILFILCFGILMLIQYIPGTSLPNLIMIVAPFIAIVAFILTTKKILIKAPSFAIPVSVTISTCIIILFALIYRYYTKKYDEFIPNVFHMIVIFSALIETALSFLFYAYKRIKGK